MLSPEQRYLKSDGTKCPNCNSTSITGNGLVEVDTGVAWQAVGCDDCNATWTDNYTLTGIENYEKATS